MNKNRFFAFGAGVQSTAALLLSIEGKLDYRLFVFADTGAETPYVYDHLEVCKGLAADAGIELVVNKFSHFYPRRKYSDLRERVGQNPLCLPLFGKGGGPGNRTCTTEHKMALQAAFARNRWGKKTIVKTGLGITIDEIIRMKPSHRKTIVNEFPLIERNISRYDCDQINKRHGLTNVKKSGCFFCPYQTRAQWQLLERVYPQLFLEVERLEERITPMEWSFTSSGKKIRNVVHGLTADLPFGECESGWCMT